jgi:aminoglycoside phosphotransferase (APT) family kinase protein
MRGKSLPTGPDDVTPAWLTAALRESGAIDRGVTQVAWESVGDDRGFTGALARLTLRYGDADATRGAPRSLVAKFSTVARAMREVRFYEEIAPLGGVPVPRMYFGAVEKGSGQVVLLLENLHGAQAGDVLKGCSPDEAARVIETIAPFHGRWWKQIPEAALGWLPQWGGDHHARQERYNRQAVLFLAQFGGTLPMPIRDLVARLHDGYTTVLDALAAAPATVIHADFHLDNILFNPPDVAPSVVVLDWQSVCRGSCAIDIAHFVFGSLNVDDRRAVADDLLHHYHALLQSAGATDYSFAAFRDHCRLALIWLLAGTIGWLSNVTLDTLVGRERALVEAAFGDNRLITALLDEDAAGLLPS